METGFHIGTKVEKEGVEAVSYALIDMLNIYAEVVKDAISVLKEMSAASPVSNCSFNNCYIGDTLPTPEVKPDWKDLPWVYGVDEPVDENDDEDVPPEEYHPSVYSTNEGISSGAWKFDPVLDGFRLWNRMLQVEDVSLNDC